MEMRSCEGLADFADADAYHGDECFRIRVQTDPVWVFMAHEFGFHELPPRNFGMIADAEGFLHLVPPPNPDTGFSDGAPVDGRFRGRCKLPRHVGMLVDGVCLGLRRNNLPAGSRGQHHSIGR